MPSPFSSPESLEDAAEVAGRLGVRLEEVGIDEMYKAYLSAMDEVFAGTDENVAEENLQARIRGNILMAISNKFGSLVLATGNQREMPTGYSTLNGDMAGGLASLKCLPKPRGH